MSTGHPLEIRTAERAGSPSKPSEDRIFTTDNAIILLDGATDPQGREYSGGWIADQAGQRLRDGLVANPRAPLDELVRTVIIGLVNEYSLVPGEAPSTTVAIL